MENKKQHYVPQIYLRNFSGEDRFINTFDKCNGKVYKAAIDNLCCLDNLYTIYEIENNDKSVPETRNLFLEKAFFAEKIEKNLEATIKYFSKLVAWWWQTKSTQKILPQDIKLNISKSIVAQILRMPEQIEYTNKTINKFVNNVFDIFSSTDASNKNTFLQDIQNLQLENINNPSFLHFKSTFFNDNFFESFAQKLADNYWTFIVSPYAEFYTCDRPITLYCHLKDVRPMYLGYTQKGAEVSYTINPCLTLTIWDRHFFSDKEIEDCTFREASRREIAHVNVLKYFTAQRHIFSVGNEFVFAQKLYAENK